MAAHPATDPTALRDLSAEQWAELLHRLRENSGQMWGRELRAERLAQAGAPHVDPDESSLYAKLTAIAETLRNSVARALQSEQDTLETCLSADAPEQTFDAWVACARKTEQSGVQGVNDALHESFDALIALGKDDVDDRTKIAAFAKVLGLDVQNVVQVFCAQIPTILQLLTAEVTDADAVKQAVERGFVTVLTVASMIGIQGPAVATP